MVDSGPEYFNCPIEHLVPGPNPRKRMDPEALDQLAQSIREHGVLTPLIVRRIDGNRCQILAGHRRWKAAQMAGLFEVPVRVLRVGENLRTVMFHEQEHRAGWKAMELAELVKGMIEKDGLTHEQVAIELCKNQQYVSYHYGLTKAPRTVQELINDNKITARHAHALKGLDPSDQSRLVKVAVEKKLSSKQLEDLADQQRSKGQKTAAVRDVEHQMQRKLGCHVDVVWTEKNPSMHIRASSREELNRIFDKVLSL